MESIITSERKRQSWCGASHAQAMHLFDRLCTYSLTNDLQKVACDWQQMRDEMLEKEDEWKEEEQVSFTLYYLIAWQSPYALTCVDMWNLNFDIHSLSLPPTMSIQ